MITQPEEVAMHTFQATVIRSRVLVLPTILLAAALPACERSGPVKEQVIDLNKPLVEKHRLRSAAKGGWKGEAWLYASIFYPGVPVNVSVRLTPEEKKTKKLPKVKVHLAIAPNKGGGAVRKADVEPQFSDCATMKNREEYTIADDGSGKVEQFPPPGPCWEVKISDPFKADARNPGTVSLPEGEYVVTTTITLEGGPELRLEPVRVTFSGK
jgi:hypothetical protein